MKGCFMFQWGKGVVFQIGGASILSEGCTALGDIGFDGGVSPPPDPLWETQNGKPRLGGSGGMKECLKSTL